MSMRELPDIGGASPPPAFFSISPSPLSLSPLIASAARCVLNRAFDRATPELVGDAGAVRREQCAFFHNRAYLDMSVLAGTSDALASTPVCRRPWSVCTARHWRSCGPPARHRAFHAGLAGLDRSRFDRRLARHLCAQSRTIERLLVRAPEGASDDELAADAAEAIRLNSEAAFYAVGALIASDAYRRLLIALLDERTPPVPSNAARDDAWHGEAILADRAHPPRLEDTFVPLASEVRLLLDGLWRADEGARADWSISSGHDGLHCPAAIEAVGTVRGRLLASALMTRVRTYRALLQREWSAFARCQWLLRRCFLEVGRRFAAKGTLAAAEDIFYLSLDEVSQILEGGCEGNQCNNYRLRAFMRRKEAREEDDVALPPFVFGRSSPPELRGKVHIVTGIAASAGYCRGKARSLLEPEDAPALLPGEVAFIPDAGEKWAPLLEKAGALVASSGGSISGLAGSARARRVPAVFSVSAGVTDGAMVLVDGYMGMVMLEKRA
jgi:phosphohistidine swiveling domain-containing protein